MQLSRIIVKKYDGAWCPSPTCSLAVTSENLTPEGSYDLEASALEDREFMYKKCFNLPGVSIFHIMAHSAVPQQPGFLRRLGQLGPPTGSSLT